MAFDGSARASTGLDRVLAKMKAAAEVIRKAGEAQLAIEAKALAAAIQAAAPERTGALKSTIRALETEPGRWAVVAGGAATTKKVRQGVKDKDFAEAKTTGGSHGEYDYVRGVEFGHRDGKGHVPAEPFFFTTYRARRAGIRRRVADRALKAASDHDLT